jgi:flagellum-specific ATP synthase
MSIHNNAELAQYCVDRLAASRAQLRPARVAVSGKISRNNGLLLEAVGCVTRLGEICKVATADGREVDASVVGFSGETTSLVLMDRSDLLPGARVTPTGQEHKAPIGYGLLGRVVDSCGVPIDNAGPLTNVMPGELEPLPVNPLRRTAINKPLDVGVRAINALLTIGRGQRLGLFAASGVGKSVLLGMMARNTEADITIVCLLGERGREVQEFIHQTLGPKGIESAVVIAIPADHTPLRRMTGARYAAALADYFRDRGHHVLLLFDSLTRYAHAGRELALAAGEFPVSGGYPASVFTDLPVLLERGGCTDTGSVTAIYTILMESEDKVDPLAEAAKSILDGHIVLSRELAQSGHYPAVDVLASTSRLRDAVTDENHRQAVRVFVHLYACYQRNKDLLSLGMYQRGDNPDLDRAVDLLPAMISLLTQTEDETITFSQCKHALFELFSTATVPVANRQPLQSALTTE